MKKNGVSTVSLLAILIKICGIPKRTGMPFSEFVDGLRAMVFAPLPHLV